MGRAHCARRALSPHRIRNGADVVVPANHKHAIAVQIGVIITESPDGGVTHTCGHTAPTTKLATAEAIDSCCCKLVETIIAAHGEFDTARLVGIATTGVDQAVVESEHADGTYTWTPITSQGGQPSVRTGNSAILVKSNGWGVPNEAPWYDTRTPITPSGELFSVRSDHTALHEENNGGVPSEAPKSHGTTALGRTLVAGVGAGRLRPSRTCRGQGTPAACSARINGFGVLLFSGGPYHMVGSRSYFHSGNRQLTYCDIVEKRDMTEPVLSPKSLGHTCGLEADISVRHFSKTGKHSISFVKLISPPEDCWSTPTPTLVNDGLYTSEHRRDWSNHRTGLFECWHLTIHKCKYFWDLRLEPHSTCPRSLAGDSPEVPSMLRTPVVGWLPCACPPCSAWPACLRCLSVCSAAVGPLPGLRLGGP